MKSGRYKLYLTHLKGSRRLLFMAIVFGLLYGSAQSVGLPVLIGKILPIIFGTATERAAPVFTFPHWLGGREWFLPKGFELTFAVGFLPAVFILRGVSQFFASYFVNLAGLRVIDSVRTAVFAKLQRMHLGFFARMPTGDLMQRLTGDVQAVRIVLVDISTDAIIQPFTLIGALGFVVFKCLSVPGGVNFLFCLLVVPVSVFLARAIGQALQKRALNALSSASDLNSIVVENLQSPREIRAYGLQEREERRFAQASLEGLRLQAKLARYDKSLSPLLEIIAACGIALAVWIGAAVGMQYTDLLMIITAIYVAYEPVKKLGRMSNLLAIAEGGLTRLEDVLLAPIEVADAADARPLGRVRGALAFDRLTFTYGEEPVLRDLTIAIPAGQSVALVGPSGAGKSTFVNLVPRFFDPQQGSIAVDGQNLRGVRQFDLRANISLVSQEPVLFNDSILENIRLGRAGATEAEVREAARLAGALDFIVAMPEGFTTRVGERGSRLSGGQRQRISIARAFLKDAPILILDEATSALDTETERGIQASLQLLMKGRTTLIVAHRFSTIRYVDRVLVFDQGRVVADGPREEVYRSNELFRRLWDNQSKGLG
ncbi:lipid A export permease/ATP-binding protein MsbA [Verrucomicrobiota bacterium]|nr:lipid A export ATP-binding/permease protein MsbA [Verrucomicrobiota bacterium]GDY17831.1 lipid A export permease/ATP-binding protein MsbA [Verrucomicrobiota bacterium]